MKLSTVAKVLAKNSPEQYREAVKLCQPMLSQPAIIPAIHERIKETYPELDRTDESILFAATVYTAYAPACLLASGVDRAPNGIRQTMCKVMGWNDAPVVNYYCDLSRAYIKGPKFKEKVANILLGFQQFSVKSNQIELF
ncbi:hypothetical protein [Mucilaginibacter lappiensis]|uniref:Uncharacterized protein n=1 Tax=Mucilaginibacter lappiensis TaxID=354630 RepID=A0A841JEA4_9SPHI|nr:hypothetical protein [Mucilaginibacter lappiensis]MBB6126958.1 hypothetical protein [Mucilaginibacter lappiensis]